MLAKKKKLGKKNIKEDKLVTFYSKSLQYFDAYKNEVLIGAAVVVVVIAAIVYFSNQAKTTEVEAAGALAKAEKVYQSGNYQAAIDGGAEGTVSLEEVASEYSGSEPGEIAGIYLANSYFYTGNYEKALEYYKDYSGSIELYKASALAGMAACYEAMEQYGDAAKYFHDAANAYSDNALNSQYLLNAAVNYIKVNDSEEAMTLLERLKEDYPTSQEARDADRYMAEAKLIAKS